MLTKGAKLLAYSALRRKLTRPPRKMKKFIEENKEVDVWEMEFPTESLGLSCFSEDHPKCKYNVVEVLNNPKTKVTIWFSGGQKLCGVIPGKWHLIVNNRLFQRLSYRDIGVIGAVSGLKAVRNKKSIIYLVPIKVSKNDKEKIMDSVSEQLINFK